MEKHKCKFCLRSFSNGRALGGHMRSHMMNLPKQTESSPPPPPLPRAPTVQLSFEAESASSLSYGLRENPKRSFRFTDPNEFIDAGSIILQEDRESETESSKNPTGPRSKRVKKVDPMKNLVQNESVSVLSSSSDITTEEDVAFFLISLSCDNNNIWKTHTQHHDQQHHQHHEEQEDEQYEQQQVEEDEDQEEDEDVEEEEESEAESEEEEEELKPLKKVRGRYKCDTCNKVFRSYQALGGHRASHKKNKQLAESGGDYSISQHDEKININVSEKKIHECPICFREFSSGQALGGHRRTHNIGFGSASKSTSTTAAATTTMVNTNIEVARVSANVGDSLLDLNFPAPMDEDEDEDEDGDDGDDDVSQVEGSAVSDAEFVKPL